MELEVKKGDVVNPRDEQKKLVIELARRVAAQRVGDNLDVITDKIAGKFAGYLSKKSTAEANAAEFEVAMEDAKGIVKETLEDAFLRAQEEVEETEDLLSNSLGDVLAAYTDKLAVAYLTEIIRTLTAARKELKAGLLTDAGTIAKSIRRTENLGEDANSTIKRLN